MELTKNDVRKTCPICNEVIIESFNRYHNMVMFWGSVHGKCPHCGQKLAYACVDKIKEKIVIITQERCDEIRKEYIRKKYAYPAVIN